MPLIVPYGFESDPPPLVILSGEAFVDAAGGVGRNIRATLAGEANIAAGLTLLSVAGPSGATLAGEAFLSATLRNGTEANKFGAAVLEGNSQLDATGRVKSRGRAVLRGEAFLSAGARVADADRQVVDVTLFLLPAIASPYGDQISARISADGVNYPITDANYSEPRTAAGVTLEVALQKPSDRDAVAAAESFKFEIYENGAWTTVFDSGRRSGGGFSFAWGENAPADVLSLSTIGPIADRLNASPAYGLTVYDTARETLDATQFPIIYDTDGRPYPRQLIPFAGLDRYALLDYILVNLAGFTAIKTDLPNDPIRRADFELSGSYLEGIAPHIGAYDPILFVIGDTVWILDGTKEIPEGWVEPVTITADQYESATFEDVQLNADGYDVTFSDDENAFDYTLDNEIVDDPEDIGSFGDPGYQEITRSRTFRDFYKLSNPFVPVRTEKVKEVEETRAMVNGDFLLINKAVEEINFDGFGKLQTINKNVTGRVRDLGDGFPVSGEITLRTERAVFDYSPDIHNPRRQVLAKVTKNIKGLIVTDSENEHLGEPFRQAYTDGFRAGNLDTGQAISFGAIQTVVDTFEQSPKGQTEARTRTTDFLTNPASVINSTTDARAGDGSVNARSGSANHIYVFKESGWTRTTGRLPVLSVGEMPVASAIALARRKLKHSYTRTGSVRLKGPKLAYARGFVGAIEDRDGSNLGNYIVEGRQIVLANLGTPQQKTTNTLDVTMVY